MDEQGSNINLIDKKSAPTLEHQQNIISVAEIDKDPQSIVATEDNTFRELRIALDKEQANLIELEERQKVLMVEMLRLKAEIAQEKISLQEKLNESESVLNSIETPYDDMYETEAIETRQVYYTHELDEEDTSFDTMAQDIIDEHIHDI